MEPRLPLPGPRRLRAALVVVAVLGVVAGVLAGCGSPAGKAPTGGAGANGSAGGSGAGGAVVTGTAGKPGTAGTTGHDGGVDAPVAVPPGPGVLMRGNDLKRTGANLFETKLSPTTVTAAGFGKLGCYTVDGEIYAQILYLPGFDFGAKGRHNALVVATMTNHVYVLDADNPKTVLWTKSYGAPDAAVFLAGTAANYTCYPYRDISAWVGIVGTPALDVQAGTIYFVARTLDGTNQVQKLYAESLVDGSDRPGSPVTIAATTAGTGDQVSVLKDPVTNGAFPFNASRANQRPALTLANGIVYIAWSSFCDFGSYHGWLIGYDAATLAQAVVFNTTPNGAAGGIWMSGSGPAVDDDGAMYLATGNGSNDLKGGSNHGESFLKLVRQGATMQVSDWFTPYEYDFLEYDDRDLGSAGVLLVPGRHLLLGGGKDAKIYVADTTNLGRFTPPTVAFQAPTSTAAEVLPVGTDAVVQTLAVATMSVPPRAHNHSTPVYWKSDAGEFVYTMAEQDFLQQWRIVDGAGADAGADAGAGSDAGTQLVLYKSSQVRAPVDPAAPNMYTMPGGTMSLSADGDKSASGVVWVTLPISKDANNATVPGMVYAFSAADVSQTLWNSEANPARDSVGDYAKFNPVTIYDGKVYVPTFNGASASNQFCAYGRL